MHNACAKNVVEVPEIEVHTWKPNVLVDWVLFLIKIPRFQKQPMVPLGTDVKNWHVFKIEAVASFLGMLGQLRVFVKTRGGLRMFLSSGF